MDLLFTGIYFHWNLLSLKSEEIGSDDAKAGNVNKVFHDKH